MTGTVVIIGVTEFGATLTADISGFNKRWDTDISVEAWRSRDTWGDRINL